MDISTKQHIKIISVQSSVQSWGGGTLAVIYQILVDGRRPVKKLKVVAKWHHLLSSERSTINSGGIEFKAG